MNVLGAALYLLIFITQHSVVVRCSPEMSISKFYPKLRDEYVYPYMQVYSGIHFPWRLLDLVPQSGRFSKPAVSQLYPSKKMDSMLFHFGIGKRIAETNGANKDSREPPFRKFLSPEEIFSRHVRERINPHLSRSGVGKAVFANYVRSSLVKKLKEISGMADPYLFQVGVGKKRDLSFLSEDESLSGAASGVPKQVNRDSNNRLFTDKRLANKIDPYLFRIGVGKKRTDGQVLRVTV